MQYQPNQPPDRRPMSSANKLLIAVSVAAIFVFGGLSILLGQKKQPPTPAPVVSNTATPQPGGYLTVDEAQAQITATPTAAPAMIVTPEPATPVPNFEMTPQPTDIPTLKKGATGDAVKSMQRRLQELGYMRPDSDDGQFGQGTENAVKAFQNANNLRADGAAGAQTLTKLFSDDAVRKPE